MTPDVVLEQARAVAGADAVRAGLVAHDAFDAVVPVAIVTPRSPEAVADVLAWANRERLSVVITGGRTHAEWGRPPQKIDVLLSVASLSRVIDHAHGDLTVTAEAGATLDAVNTLLATRKQYLPFDTARPDHATLGGLVATNDSGPLRHRYGTPRDLVIGATFATADGLIARSGGRVVKNVAGYDLARLLAGSHGSLAAILSLTFKLFPQPASTRTAVLTGAPEALSAVWARIVNAQLEPMAIEVQAAGDYSQELLVRFGSDTATVENSLGVIGAMAGGLDVRCRTVAAAEDTADWVLRNTLVWSKRHVVRISWAVTDLPKVFALLATIPREVDWTFAGRAGVGSGHLGFDADATAAVGLVTAWRLAPALAHVTIVQGSRELRQAVDPWGPLPGAASVWPSLKRSWDPLNTLGADRGPL